MRNYVSNTVTCASCRSIISLISCSESLAVLHDRPAVSTANSHYLQHFLTKSPLSSLAIAGQPYTCTTADPEGLTVIGFIKNGSEICGPLQKIWRPKTSKFRRDFKQLCDLIANISRGKQRDVNRKTALLNTIATIAPACVQRTYLTW